MSDGSGAGPGSRGPERDLAAVEARWADWVESTARLLAIDPGLVDIPAIHDLTKTIAHDLDRPLAPVASFMLGVAIGARGSDADPSALKDTIAATAHGTHGAATAHGTHGAAAAHGTHGAATAHGAAAGGAGSAGRRTA